VRSVRGAAPTEIGAAYHGRLAAVFGELEAANEAVALATSEIAGPIRVTGPVSFGVEQLSAWLAEFMLRHPRVEIELVLDDRHVDLVAEHFDLAIRMGRLADSSLVARKLATVRAVAVASPAYLESRGRPSHPRELTDHDALIYTNTGAAEWRFRIDDRWERIRVTGRLRSNNGEALREAARAGLGILVLPAYLAVKALNDGSLVAILDAFPLEDAGLYAVLPPGRSTTARLRALVDHLADSVKQSLAKSPVC
jgi:DNA-binding transcriptional LysR family regulator